MAPQGEAVARQWFIPGDGIDRNVITGDIQRYLGNDATVRPGVGTGEYQGVQGYWIKGYRNLTSAMIADLRADSQRWRQEQQRQPGSGGNAGYVNSRTYHESNAAIIQRRDGNSASIDVYDGRGPPRPVDGRSGDPRRAPPDAMQMDTPPGRGPPPQGYGDAGYYQQDSRAPYAADPSRYPPQGRGQGYGQDQLMSEYGQPDQHGRYPINHSQPDRAGNYAPPVQGPPGHIRQGEYWVPVTSGYQQGSMMATTGPDTGYYGGQGQPPPRGQGQANRGPGRDPGYNTDYGPYPSPAQTVSSMNVNPQDREQYGNTAPRSGYPPGQYEQQRPSSNSAYQYPPDTGYPPQTRDSAHSRPAPSGQSERRRNR